MSSERDGADAIERSQGIFPAGSNGEFDLPASHAIVIRRGEGCQLWDTRGRRFLDFSMGWGSVLVGHAHPRVVAAVQAQAGQGSNFSFVTEKSLELAERIRLAIPALERLRFAASGTEATMYCQRIARAFTGRPKLLKFEGAYHGANEVGVTSLFSARQPPYPEPDPSSAGIGPLVMDHVLVAPFNDLDTTTRIVKDHAGELAGIIVEPLHRCLPPREAFLAGLRALCDRLGLLLIYDEVVTGFRLAYGGASEYYGVAPDLAAYGKALGGGYPIGAFGGRAEIVDLVREDRLNRQTYVWTASTLGGNPVSASAALTALDIYREPGTYDRLHFLGRYLRDGMRRVIEQTGAVAQVIGDGPLAQIVFTDQPLADSRSIWRADGARGRALMLDLFARGVFLNPMGTKLYLSLAHDESTCDEFLDHLRAALARV